MEPLFVSVNEAGKALNIGRTSIYELMRSGELETIKMGRRRLVKVASLRRLASDHQEGGE